MAFMASDPVKIAGFGHLFIVLIGMLVKTFTIFKADLLDEASHTDEGQNFIVRAVLGRTEEYEFLPTGFNDCWDLVLDQIKRKVNANHS